MNFFSKTFFAFLSVSAMVFAVAMIPAKEKENNLFHTEAQMQFLQQMQMQMDPIDSGEYFLQPFTCQGCHGYDPLHIGNVDLDSNDVNLYDDWETSMMGLSAADPFWRAKVSQEIITNPGHSNELQTLCTKCHAPMGHFTAMYHGAPHYLISDVETDSLGRAGVACGGCHSILPDSITGLEFSGNLHYDTNHVEYGPFTLPIQGPMQLYVNITPEYSTHMEKSQVCASCHTLISEVADLSGNLTGNTFVEQATYHEWLNSSYPALNKTCQTCHMPQIEDPVKLSNGFSGLIGRTPFNLHQFAGANSFMVNLIKNNKDSLGVIAPDNNFDSTLKVIDIMLRENTLTVEVDTESVSGDTAYFAVTLTNKAGHKFPTGYPSRRAVLQFVAIKENGDTLFASGLYNSLHEVINMDSPFEPHYNVINDPAQVQIYEMVMNDVAGNKTSLLERADTKPKDNRILPLGFTTSHSAYDTAFISGNALNDPDFNKNGLSEGTGKDIVHYHIATNGYKGKVNVTATVYYQSIPPDWLTEMRTLSSQPIDRFLGMFDAEDNSPLTVAGDTLNGIQIPDGIRKTRYATEILISPNPTSTGKISIKGRDVRFVTEIQIFNSGSELCKSFAVKENNDLIQLELPAAKGIYFLVFITPSGRTVKKVFKF